MDRPPACNLKSGPDGKLKSNLEWPKQAVGKIALKFLVNQGLRSLAIEQSAQPQLQCTMDNTVYKLPEKQGLFGNVQ